MDQSSCSPRTPSQTKPDFVQTEIIIHLWNKMKQFMISEPAVFELVPTGKSVFPWKKVISVHVRVLYIKSYKIRLLLNTKRFSTQLLSHLLLDLF